MKELRDKIPNGKDLMMLNDHQVSAVILGITNARATNPDPIATKHLSVGELENIYDSTSVPAATQQEINYRLMEAYQWLLSQGYIMPAPGQPAGVVIVTSKGRLGLPTGPDGDSKSLLEWVGGARVTLAIVFTDIVGSTDLGNELGDVAMREVRYAHFAQSKLLLAKHAGREIKTLGDSVMAVFRSVDAAFDYAHALHLHPGHEALTAQGIRAGIHIGPVDVGEKDIDGNEVAFAHRVIEAIAGSEIWLSNRAKEDLSRAGLHREWQIHDLPMKGFGEQRLWSLIAEPTRTNKAFSSARPPAAVSAPKFQPAEYRDGEARFRAASEPIGISKTGEKPIFLHSGAAMWLRVMPANDPGRTWASHELEKNTFKSRISDLAPLAFSFVSTNHDLHFLRARDGFGVYFANHTRGVTTSVAFAFRTGEIWSIDTGELASCPNDLPEPSIEETYAVHLHGYALFLQNLGIDPPYRWIAGLVGVNGRRLQIRNRSFPGPLCLQDMITDNGMYDLQQNMAAILRPFFDKIFAECGLPRPRAP